MALGFDSWRTGRGWWLALAAVSSTACAPKLLVQPWPCVRIEEAPEVDSELLLMKSMDLYRATREWVVAADAKCAADRVLAGKAAMQKPKLSWWERSWLGRLLRWPERR